MSRRKSTFVRPEQPETLITGRCRTRTAVAGEAIAGCMIAGRLGNSSAAIPQGTFNGNTL